MLTFQTYRQYTDACTDKAANSHRPPAGPFFWTCETCGKVAPNSESYGILGGSAKSMHCYRCCHARDVAELKDTTKPFCAYLSGDGKAITNWPGECIARVTQSSHSRTGWNGAQIYRIRAIDVHGQIWHGMGAGPGRFVTLRAFKGSRHA